MVQSARLNQQRKIEPAEGFGDEKSVMMNSVSIFLEMTNKRSLFRFYRILSLLFFSLGMTFLYGCAGKMLIKNVTPSVEIDQIEIKNQLPIDAIVLFTPEFENITLPKNWTVELGAC